MGNGVFWWKTSIDWTTDYAHTFCTALEGVLVCAGWMTAPGARGRGRPGSARLFGCGASTLCIKIPLVLI